MSNDGHDLGFTTPNDSGQNVWNMASKPDADGISHWDVVRTENANQGGDSPLDTQYFYDQGGIFGGLIPAGGLATAENWYSATSKMMAGETVPVILSSMSKYGRVAEIGTGVGVGIAITGAIMDYNAWKRGDITATKFWVNQGFSVLGLIPNPYTVAASAIYFGVDAFYPGGWNGLGNDVSNSVTNTWNQFTQGVSQYNNIYKWVPHQ